MHSLIMFVPLTSCAKLKPSTFDTGRKTHFVQHVFDFFVICRGIQQLQNNNEHRADETIFSSILPFDLAYTFVRYFLTN